MDFKWLTSLFSKKGKKEDQYYYRGYGYGYGYGGRRSRSRHLRLIGEHTSPRVIEAYSMMRTNLLYMGADSQSGTVFGFTSASPGDGKSLTCANTAISFAMSGKRVLLLDCDMRKPTQNVAFEMGTERGLSEYLAGVCPTPEILETKYENLSLILAGRCPPNPAELLYRPRFAELIRTLKGQYDFVFVDLPPVGVVSDATIVSPYIKFYVCVIRSGKSDSRAVQHMVESIEQLDGKIAGFVLNETENRYRSAYRNNRYGKHYGYYSHKNGAEDAADAQAPVDAPAEAENAEAAPEAVKEEEPAKPENE